jgi:hypothetical protein
MRNVSLCMKLAPAALLLLLVADGCKKKDEEPPPIPSAAPAPTPVAAPTPVVVMPEEDAAADAPVDAPPDVKKTGTAAPADVAGLRACCNALQQNAASMPPPQNAYAISAATLCQGMVQAMATGSITKGGALGAIGGALKGAGLPAACH